MHWRILIGFAVSAIGGHIFIGPFVSWMWRFLVKKTKNLPEDQRVPEIHAKPSGALSMPLGVVERVIYTAAVLTGAWEVIAGWFVLKSAAKWKNVSSFRGADNIWLIGNALSLIFGVVGAYVASGKLPILR